MRNKILQYFFLEYFIKLMLKNFKAYLLGINIYHHVYIFIHKETQLT